MQRIANRADLLLRWRNHALGDAQRALAEAIGRQDAAQRAFDAAARDLIEKRELAASSEDDAGVDDYAAWLPAGRRTLNHAADRLRREALAAAATRAALKLARAAGKG